MGINVWAHEATQVYLGNQDHQLSRSAGEFVSELSTERACYARIYIVLIAILGNLRAPTTAVIAANRIRVVDDILTRQGLDPLPIIARTDDPYVDAVPPGIIGRVVMMTQR